MKPLLYVWHKAAFCLYELAYRYVSVSNRLVLHVIIKRGEHQAAMRRLKTVDWEKESIS